jgi:UDP-galactopyranose mutase
MKKIIILGCGISGVTLARLYAEKNYQVDIYETRDHIGGNCYDYYDNHGILVHKYGPHIFHTSNEIVYKFINRFCKLNGYINKVKVKVGNKIVPLPINFKSIKQIFPLEANYIIKKLVNLYRNQKTITLSELQNIKDKKIHLLFKYIYKNVYANYSQKMWSVPIKLLSKDIINRVQITLSYGESYFPNDKYQGLPKEGYTKFIENMLNHKNIKIHLKAREDILKFKGNMTYINNIKCNDKIFYCGSIDRLFKYKFGKLNYRSLYIHFQSFKKSKYQPSAIVNYPSHPLMTRCCEYKQMTLQNSQ